MNDNKYNSGCLSDDEIELLAMRIGALKDIDVSCQDQRGELPDSYKQCLSESTQAHLQDCQSCREKLSAESRVYRAYFEPLDTLEADRAIRKRIESNLRESIKELDCRMLTFVPGELSMEEEPALAAATEFTTDQSMLFAEKDEAEDLIFKKDLDPVSGKEICHLIGSDSRFTKNAELLIDGEYYRADEKGRVALGEKMRDLCEDTIIIVFPGGQNTCS